MVRTSFRVYLVLELLIYWGTPMTTTKQFYQLQQLDHEIANLRAELLSLEKEVGNRTSLDMLNSQLDASKNHAAKLHNEQLREELDAEDVRQRLDGDRSMLYGGSITNLRELEAQEKEVVTLQAQLHHREEELLKVMMTLEEAQTEVHRLNQRCWVAQQDWINRQESLSKMIPELLEQLSLLHSKRWQSTTALKETDLSLYEELMLSKRGTAVVLVVRDLCRGCLISLPTHRLQRARLGRELVLCDSCGRILHVS
jgi:predicted  nucleic acid-binding Zn-ribbon protein